ncbi:MAG: hypothetical protein LIO74_10960 [Ruminococcus sp.]|nr:hypothetical protein [Ruminococcus sp.]
METYIGAILSKNRNAMNGGGGNYCEEDKILYMLSPIPHPLETVQVEFNGVRYTPLADRDHEDAFFTGVYVYKLSQVDKFREGVQHGN